MDTTIAPAQPQAGPMPNPERILSTLNGFIESAALKGAVELDLFTAVGDGFTRSSDLAERCQASERGIRILCDYLTVLGFLTKEDSHYGLTPESSTFLNKRSPMYMGSVSYFMGSDHLKQEFRDVAQLVREGGALDHGAALEPGHAMWVEFARSMAPMMRLPANLLAEIVAGSSERPMKVLDIAAGHGLYGITVAQKNRNAQITAVDWPNVLDYAKSNAASLGVADRYHTIAGSAFDVDFGNDYDIVLVPNFLHHFDPPKIEEFLRKVHAALKPGGMVAILEFTPNEDRVSPPFPAKFSMMMLGGTPSGDAYTSSQLEEMLQNAGFRSTQRHDLVPTPSTLLISTT